jgi:hypothetical protein
LLTASRISKNGQIIASRTFDLLKNEPLKHSGVSGNKYGERKNSTCHGDDERRCENRSYSVSPERNSVLLFGEDSSSV